MINPDDFVITRRRKKYKFAHFANLDNCFEADQWHKLRTDQPLVIELGAGTAHFSVELARRHPECHYVAIDVKADRLQVGARLAAKEGLANITFVRAHADQLLELFDADSIAEIWLTFSDPFPKKRHAKHRMTNPRFLMMYRQLLVESGLLRMKTDNHALFDWSLERCVSQKWNITELSYDLHNLDVSEDYKITTTFEKRYISENLPIYYFAAKAPMYQVESVPSYQ